MEHLKEWSTVLCISAVASGILIFLIPEGKLKKTVEITVSLLLMFLLVSIFSGKYDFPVKKNHDSSFNIENYSDDFDEYLIEQSRNTVEEIISTELSGICNNSFSVKTDWNITDNTITMNNIEITVADGDMTKINIIKSKIVALTGLVPEVKIR